MKTMFILFLWGTIGLATSGCEEKEDELQSQVDNLEFELVVLDEEGEQQSVFEPFTDITFAVRITNQLDEDFLWEYSYGCQLVQSEEFLLVYKVVNSSETGGSKIDSIGKPYPYPVDCLLFKIPPNRFHQVRNYFSKHHGVQIQTMILWVRGNISLSFNIPWI